MAALLPQHMTLTLGVVPGQDLRLPGGEHQWDVLVGEGENQFSQDLCFEDEEVTEDKETEGEEVTISTSSNSDKEIRITLGLGAGQCVKEMDPAKRMVGMVIFGLGLGTVLFVVGYMVKNQLEVCADPRRNL